MDSAAFKHKEPITDASHNDRADGIGKLVGDYGHPGIRVDTLQCAAPVGKDHIFIAAHPRKTVCLPGPSLCATRTIVGGYVAPLTHEEAFAIESRVDIAI